MAEDKKPAHASGGGGLDFFNALWWIIIFLCALAVYNRISVFVKSRLGNQSVPEELKVQITQFSLFQEMPVLTTFLWLISFLFFGIMIYLLLKINAIMVKISGHDHGMSHAGEHGHDESLDHPVPYERHNEKWEEIQNLARSNSESMWRLAILEADILLEEMLRALGFQGEDMGERLKSANKNEFESIDKAWEGHKVRNKIAHEGSAYQITHDEVERIIKLYEDVFNEFKFI